MTNLRRHVVTMGRRPILLVFSLVVSMATTYMLCGRVNFVEGPPYAKSIYRPALNQIMKPSSATRESATIVQSDSHSEQNEHLTDGSSLSYPESSWESPSDDDNASILPENGTGNTSLYSSSYELPTGDGKSDHDIYTTSQSNTTNAQGTNTIYYESSTNDNGSYAIDNDPINNEYYNNTSLPATNTTNVSKSDRNGGENSTRIASEYNTSITLPLGRKEYILRIQEERKNWLMEVCRGNKEEIGGDVIFKDTYRHTYVVDREKLLFCYIPKVGCSNWKRILMVLARKRDVTDDITSKEAHAHNGITRLGQLSKEAREYRLQNYRKVMFVREPLARVVSAYKNKYADLSVYRSAPRVFHHFGKRIIRKYRDHPSQLALATGENVTWPEFVKYLTDKSERPNFDRHWKEMYKLCSPCQIRYDFIGKLESVSEEADYVLRNFNFTRDVKFPGRENSHPTNITSSTAKYFESFSSETLRALWDIYSMDYRLFGYDKPNYVK